MSRIATNEYIGAKRRAYEASKPDKRRLILDDVCEMTGYSRKYANRLLTGNRKFKVRKGRGATYTERDKAIQNLHESVQFLTNAMKISTTKECPFYLTNWAGRNILFAPCSIILLNYTSLEAALKNASGEFRLKFRFNANGLRFDCRRKLQRAE